MSDGNKATEIEERLILFAVRVIKGADALPKTPVNADFVHKLKIALKELNESSVWLRMICRAEVMKIELLDDLIDENQQLCRILNASIY